MQKILDDAVREGRDLTSMGKTADYIPELEESIRIILGYVYLQKKENVGRAEIQM